MSGVGIAVVILTLAWIRSERAESTARSDEASGPKSSGEHPAVPSTVSAPVVTAATRADRQSDLVPVTAAEYLKVRVLAPDGSLVPDAFFALFCFEEANISRVEISAEAQSIGEYRILPATVGNEKTTSWPDCEKMRLDVTCDRYGKVTAAIASGERSVEVRFADRGMENEPSTLTVRLVDYSPVKESTILVALLPSNEDPTARRGWIEEEIPDEGPDVGKAVFTGLECQKYSLFVLERLSTIVSRVVDIHAGMNEVMVSLPPLLTVTVFVPDGQEKDELVLFLGPNPIGRSRHLDANLQAVFDRLPAGDYVFTHIPVSGTGGGYERFRVESTCVVTFRPTPMNSLIVRMTTSVGVFARAGFRDGDVITRINGESFHDYPSLHNAYYKLLSGVDMVKYTVQRDHAMTDIYVGMKSVSDTLNWGALIQPFER
jgi:hypothetical protein